MEIVDLSVPGSPNVVAAFDLGPGNQPAGVAAAGSIVFACDPISELGTSSTQAVDLDLAIIDVSKPSAPVLAGSFETHSNRMTRIVVDGTRAYVSDDGEGLLVLDISTPTAPVRLGSYHSPAYLRKMDKVGDLLYVSDALNGFSIVDLSDPTAPSTAGIHQTQPDGLQNWGIEVRDGLAYLAAAYAGLEIADVGTPASPALAGSFALTLGPCDRSWDLELDDASSIVHLGVSVGCLLPHAYLLNLDVSDPRHIQPQVNPFNPLLLGPGWPFAIDAQPGLIYHVAMRNIAVVDWHDAANPEIVNYGVGPFCEVIDLEVFGNYRYAADDTIQGISGLYVHDVSKPLNPEPPFAFLAAADTRAVAVDAGTGYVFFTGTWDTIGPALIMLEPSGPELEPVVLDAVPVWGATGASSGSSSAYGPYLFAEDGYVFLTTIEGGLVIYRYLPETLPADLNGDGVVNTLDLGILLAGWTIPPRTVACGGTVPCPADINHDGVVNTLDLGILLSQWTL